MNIPTNHQLSAEIAFIREVMLDFYAVSIESGAHSRERVIAHLRSAAGRAQLAHPVAVRTIEDSVATMIDALPSGPVIRGTG